MKVAFNRKTGTKDVKRNEHLVNIKKNISTEALSKILDYNAVKIRVNTIDIPCPVAVMVKSCSGTFTIIFDKEFERTCKCELEQLLGNEKRCKTELNKTNSGNILFDLDNINVYNGEEEHTFLIKSPSGQIKILSNKSIFEEEEEIFSCENNIDNEKNINFKTSEINSSSKIDKGLTGKTMFSDYSFRRNVKIILQDYKQKDIETPGTMMRFTDNYIIQFEDLSNPKLNRIKLFLSVYKQCYIPIKINSVKDTVALLLDKDRIVSGKDMHGLLKLTHSGNIMIVIDEQTMDTVDKKTLVSLSYHMLLPVTNPKDKTMNTSCNARSTMSSSDICNKSKCDCSSLPNDVKRFWLSEQQGNSKLRMLSSSRSIHKDEHNKKCKNDDNNQQIMFFKYDQPSVPHNSIVEESVFNTNSTDFSSFGENLFDSNTSQVDNYSCVSTVTNNNNSTTMESSLTLANTTNTIEPEYSDLFTYSSNSETFFNLPLQLPHCLRYNYITI